MKRSVRIRLCFEGSVAIWWVGRSAHDSVAYLIDHHGWLRIGSIDGPYLFNATGWVVHQTDRLTALTDAWQHQSARTRTVH